MKVSRSLRYSLPAVFVILIAAVFFVPPAQAERPSSPDLLPENTLAVVRLVDIKDLVDKLKQTGVGRLAQQENISGLVAQLYGSAAEAFGQIEDQVGLSLDQLLSIPQGEICFAIVPPEEGNPAVVVFIDVGDQVGSARKLISRGEEFAEQSGVAKNTETIRKTEVTYFERPGRRNQQIGYFEREGTVVIFTNLDVAKNVLDRWDGKSDELDNPLADNRNYTTIMSRSRGTKDEKPQITFYVDPIETIKISTRNTPGAQIGLAVIPALGLDGLEAIGGSLIYATEEFNEIVHLHLLLDSPRTGVLEALAMTSGETEPEPWVPEDVSSYTTMNWDFGKTYSTIERLYDSFSGEGAFGELVGANVSERVGIDLKKDVIDQLDDRFTLATWIVPPARINSQSNLVGIHLKDGKKFRSTLKKVVEQIGDGLERKSYGGVEYYKGQGPGRRFNAEAGEDRVRLDIRAPSPCVAILGDDLLISDSEEFMKRAIMIKSDGKQTLAKDLEFKLIYEKIKRHAGESKPAMISFNRPEQTFKMLYEMVQSDNTRETLADRGQDNRFFSTLDKALKDNPLPPFEEIAKYLAPGGAMVTSDETGIHFIGFGLKRKQD